MIHWPHAILAGALLLGGAAAAVPPPDDPAVLDEPMRVRFRLADEVRITGDLTEWDADGFRGSFGRREWLELATEDVWTLHRRLMDMESADDWINVGRLLLQMPDHKQWPEAAFRRALKINPDAQALIDAARAEAEAAARKEQELAQAAEAERLSTTSPEAADWRAQPWPELSEEERENAVKTMKSAAGDILEKAGIQLLPVETSYFLFYSDMPRQQAANWARQLDNMYRRLANIFDLEPGENLFWGKAVIFVFNDRDRFELVEGQAFNHLVPKWTAGLCHFRGPQVFINFFRQPDDLDFAAILVHETVHGFMHRYRTPVRMPTWANEGFADYLAATTFEHSPIDLDRRRLGLEFVREGGNVDAVLDLSYQDGSWPGPGSIGYGVGYLLVELMIRDRSRRFGDWVNAIKAGKDWQQALVEDFGVERATLIERFVQFYLVND